MTRAMVLGLFAILLFCILEVSFATDEETCPFDAESFLSNSTSSDWDEASNWNEGVVPHDTTHVVLEGDTELDSSTRISSLSIKSGAKLTVTGNLKLIPTAITCFNTNWCSGHGECVAVDQCNCEVGWSGDDCATNGDSERETRGNNRQQILHEKRGGPAPKGFGMHSH